MKSVHDFEAKDIDGQNVQLGRYRDKVLLVVNVASKCGLTPQYAGLEALYRKHREQGLVVLGFPCDQFGHQEPGTDEEIKAFCSTRYDVSFPLFTKIDVNGSNAHPLYRHLRAKGDAFTDQEPIAWNFTKFLVDRRGKLVRRFKPQETPEQIESAIAAELGQE
jgi:glutathione peroxidase